MKKIIIKIIDCVKSVNIKVKDCVKSVNKFFDANPVMKFCFFALIIFSLPMLAWIRVRDDPGYAHIRIAVEQGLSVDSAIKLKKDLEFQGYVEQEILGDSLQGQ